MRSLPALLLVVITGGCQWLLPIGVGPADAPRPELVWAEGRPLLDRAGGETGADRPRLDGPPLDAAPPGCELTEPPTILDAGCDATCAPCPSSAGWSHAWDSSLVWRGGSSARLDCSNCPSEHLLSFMRVSGTWNLTGFSGFYFRMRTEGTTWLDSKCHLTPTLFLYDTAGRSTTVQRISKTHPPFPDLSVGRWLEIAGPLKQPTTDPDWYPVGHSQFDFAHVKTIQIRAADAASLAFTVRVDGLTFTGGAAPFDQCP